MCRIILNVFLGLCGIFAEFGHVCRHMLSSEVLNMLSGGWLVLGALLCSLQLQTGSFPKPLTESEEKYYLKLASKGDLEARNILVERNLRLVAHVMIKY